MVKKGQLWNGIRQPDTIPHHFKNGVEWCPIVPRTVQWLHSPWNKLQTCLVWQQRENNISSYIRDLNTGLVQYLNGQKLSDCQMAGYSNGDLNTNYHLKTGHLNTRQLKVFYSDVSSKDHHCSFKNSQESRTSLQVVLTGPIFPPGSCSSSTWMRGSTALRPFSPLQPWQPRLPRLCSRISKRMCRFVIQDIILLLTNRASLI